MSLGFVICNYAQTCLVVLLTNTCGMQIFMWIGFIYVYKSSPYLDSTSLCLFTVLSVMLLPAKLSLNSDREIMRLFAYYLSILIRTLFDI